MKRTAGAIRPDLPEIRTPPPGPQALTIIERDQRSLSPLLERELVASVLEMAFARGLLVLAAGENTLRLSPPLTITPDQADFAIETLEECLKNRIQETG